MVDVVASAVTAEAVVEDEVVDVVASVVTEEAAVEDEAVSVTVVDEVEDVVVVPPEVEEPEPAESSPAPAAR